MTLTPQVIETAKKHIDVKGFYSPAEKVTAQHILYQQFIDGTKWKGVPKVIFYILLQDAFGGPYLKDDNGNLGYAIMLSSEQNVQVSDTTEAK